MVSLLWSKISSLRMWTQNTNTDWLSLGGKRFGAEIISLFTRLYQKRKKKTFRCSRFDLPIYEKHFGRETNIEKKKRWCCFFVQWKTPASHNHSGGERKGEREKATKETPLFFLNQPIFTFCHSFFFPSFSNAFHLLCMFPFCCSKTTSSDL